MFPKFQSHQFTQTCILYSFNFWNMELDGNKIKIRPKKLEYLPTGYILSSAYCVDIFQVFHIGPTL